MTLHDEKTKELIEQLKSGELSLTSLNFEVGTGLLGNNIVHADFFKYDAKEARLHRMQHEYDDLDSRIIKLSNFINCNDKFALLSDKERKLMKDQLKSMRAYAHSLAKLVNIALDNSKGDE